MRFHKLGRGLAVALLGGVVAWSSGVGAEGPHGHPHGHDHGHAEAPEVVPAVEQIRRQATPDPRTLSDDEIIKRLEHDLTALGSMSVGRPNGGALLGGVQLKAGPHIEVAAPGQSYGTAETVAYIERAVALVQKQFPGSHKLFVGHLSHPQGGRLHPHRSHQSGRDADVSYYYKPAKAAWYQKASKHTLDLPRTWAFVRALVTETDVEYLFINRNIQRMIHAYALSIGEDAKWLDSLFQYRSRHPAPIIRHSPGHDTHIHVRFYNPKAQALGKRAHKWLAKQGIIRGRHKYSRYLAKDGDTLTTIAKRFALPEKALQRVNGGRLHRVIAGNAYTIPARTGVRPMRPLAVPARRLPPEPSAGTAASVAATRDSR